MAVTADAESCRATSYPSPSRFYFKMGLYRDLDGRSDDPSTSTSTASNRCRMAACSRRGLKNGLSTYPYSPEINRLRDYESGERKMNPARSSQKRSQCRSLLSFPVTHFTSAPSSFLVKPPIANTSHGSCSIAPPDSLLPAARAKFFSPHAGGIFDRRPRWQCRRRRAKSP